MVTERQIRAIVRWVLVSLGVAILVAAMAAGVVGADELGQHKLHLLAAIVGSITVSFGIMILLGCFKWFLEH